jgi:hypothetical protein
VVVLAVLAAVVLAAEEPAAGGNRCSTKQQLPCQSVLLIDKILI